MCKVLIAGIQEFLSIEALLTLEHISRCPLKDFIYINKCVSCSVVSDFFTPRSVAHQAPLWNSLGKILSGYHFLLQEIFLTQGLNADRLHCRQILYHLSHQGIYISKS